MRAVIFDLDRTLHDRDASVLKFLQAQHQFLNTMQPVPLSYIDRFIELECNGYVWKDKVYDSLANEFSLPISSEELLQNYLNGFHEHCQEMKGASPLLASLKTKGYKVGMVTNGMTDVQNKTIDSLGLRSHFDTIVISEEAGMKKPDPRIFETAAEAMGIHPCDCLYAGDHYENDILAARKAGMKAAWLIDSHVSIHENEADVVVNSLEELKDYLMK